MVSLGQSYRHKVHEKTTADPVREVKSIPAGMITRGTSSSARSGALIAQTYAPRGLPTRLVEEPTRLAL